ncbi:MAG TPA: Flp pilus assembly protein CpaB [Tepidisphaeraceae bacterium]
MNWKAWLPLGVAIVLGLIAARVAMNLVSAPQSGQSIQMQRIVVASRDIEPGAALTAEDLAPGQVDAANAPVGTFSAPHEATGRVTKIALVKGQPILQSVLAHDGAGAGVAVTLPPGMRAFTVSIDETSGVAGMIQPTCRVDVVTTLQSDGRSKAKTLLENIHVLSVGSRLSPNAPQTEPAKSVTLLVTPSDAEKLELASSTGRVRLLLRNGHDQSLVGSDGQTIAELKGEVEVKATEPTQAVVNIPRGMRAYTVEVNDISGVAGFVQPNSKVDVVNTTGVGASARVSTLLSSVHVLAVGSTTKPNPTGVEMVRTITLLLKPKEVEQLDLATVTGRLRLALRNGDDVESETVAEVEVPKTSDPFGDSVMPVGNSKAQKREWTVEVIKGGTRSSETFQLPGEPGAASQWTDVPMGH